MQLNRKLVLVKVDEVKEKTDSGIWVQEEWQTKPPEGIIEQVAEDVTFCKPGDRVFFERYTSISVSEDKTLRLCREDAILINYGQDA